MALIADNIFLYFYILFHSFGDIFQSHFYLYTNIRPFLYTISAATEASAKAGKATYTQVFEYRTHMRENILHIHAAEIAKSVTTHTCMTKLVVTGTFLRVT